jgi:hypothetical protein
VTLAGLAACVRTPPSQVAATPAAVATQPVAGGSPRPAPHRTPAVRSTAAASSTASHGTFAAPNRTAGRARSAVEGAPQILGASVHPSVVGSGTVVSAVVRTTPGVVSVVATAAGVSIAVPRTGLGAFAGSTTIPPLPPFAHGSYAVTFIARDALGRSTQSAVGVRVR